MQSFKIYFKLLNGAISKFILLILLFGTLGTRAQLENRPFQVIDQRDGMPNSSVFAIFQDSDDYMWFGTMGGLTRYDGYSFTNYKHEAYNANSLPDNWIQAITQDHNGNLWVGTHNGGLSVLETRMGTFHNFMGSSQSSEVLASQIIWGLNFDSKKRIWMGSDKGFAVINPVDFKEVKLKNHAALSDSVAGNSVNAFLEVKETTFLCTWGSGLVVYNEKSGEIKKFTKSSIPGSISDNKLKDILLYNDSTVYINSQRSGLIRLNLRTWQFEQIDLGPFSGIFLVNLEKDALGKIWIGTQRDGMIQYDPQNERYTQFTHQPNIGFSIPSNWVSSIHIDKSGLLWAATDMGVCKTQAAGSGFSNYPLNLLHPKKLSFEVRSLLDHENRLWIGSIGGGLFEFDKETKSLVEDHTKFINSAMRDDRIWALAMDYKGEIWMATGQGVFVYNPKTRKLREYHTQADNPQSLVYENTSNLWANGHEMWIGTWGGGFSIYNLDTDTWENYSASEKKGSLSINYIADFYRDKKGRIWVGTIGGGLNLFDRKNKSFKAYKYSEKNKNSLSSNNVNDIEEDPNGRLWLATDGGGLSIFNPETEEFTTYTEKEGVADNSVWQIIRQSKDIFWLATSHGLSRFNLKTNKIEILGQQSGLIIDQFSKGFAREANGNFWLSTSNGIVKVEPTKVQTKHFDPAIRLTKFKRFNRVENPSVFMKDGFMQLQHDDYVISFDFASLDFRAPEQNRYQYILEGFHDKWIQLENLHSITFPTLPHGKYTLRVRGTNSEGQWSSHELRLPIYVAPPFYKTIWFYGVLALILSALVYLLIRWRTRNLYLMREKLEQQVEERTLELESEKQKVIDYSTEVEKQRDYVTQQRDMIIAQNKEMTDSILYAKRIQNGLLPEIELISPYFNEHWIIFKPRDIVSGDFYWFGQQSEWLYIAVADCTGHGVPGAFMSLLGLNYLNQIMKVIDNPSTSTMLNELRREVIAALSKSSNTKKIRDGIDIGLMRLNLYTLELEYSGAYNSLLLIRKDAQVHPLAQRSLQIEGNPWTLSEFRGQRMPIGQHDNNSESFSTTQIQLEKGDRIYLFTDGYVDQMNSEMNCKYYVKTFKEKLLQIQDTSLQGQQQILETTHQQWRGTARQIDDILVMALEI